MAVDQDLNSAFLESVYHFMRGDYERARWVFKREISLNPGDERLYTHLALCEHQTGEINSALESFRRTIILNDRSLPALTNRGLICQNTQRYPEAEAHFRRALEIDPHSAETHNNLGLALQSLTRLEDAKLSYRAAIKEDPLYAHAWNNLGNVFLDQGSVDMSIFMFMEAQRLDNSASTPSFNLPFAHLYKTDDAMRVRNLTELASKKHLNFSQFRHKRRNNLIPVVGFVSGDLRQHPVGTCLIPVVEHLHKRGMSLSFYSISAIEDHITDRFKRCGDYVSSYLLTEEALHKKILSDGIDILIDLSGFTAGNRLSVFARKSAPIQMTWFGYPGTTGLSQIDYLIASETELNGLDDVFTEKLIKLPHTTICFQPTETGRVSGLPYDKNGFITFGSFNALKKVGGEVISLWSAILRGVPTARMLLKAPALDCPDTQRKYLKLFSDNEVHPDRISMEGYTNSALHRSAMERVDIALDPFPYSGGVTTIESLWMGLPVITLPGMSYPSRHSAAYLTTVGLDKLICDAPGEYVFKAIDLAESTDYLRSTRLGMRDRILESPLCDTEGFSDYFYDVLIAAWSSR